MENDTLLESVHLCDWPVHDDSAIDDDMMKRMDITRSVVTMALEIRAREGIPVRQALSRLVVKGTDLDPDFLDLVKEELNVKEVITAPGDVLAVELDTKITPELKLEGICRDLTRHINDRRKKMGLSFKDKIDLYIETPDPEIQACIDQFKARLMMAVQADAITDVIEQDTNIEKMEIRGSPVKFIIKRK